jgi:hypothetical protein
MAFYFLSIQPSHHHFVSLLLSKHREIASPAIRLLTLQLVLALLLVVSSLSQVVDRLNRLLNYIMR